MRKPLRVLHLISSLNPAQGGPSEGLRLITACSVRIGVLPSIVTLDKPGEPWLKAEGVPVYALGPTRLGKYSWSSRLVPWLQQNASAFDAAVVHGLWQFHGPAAWWALRAYVPYFVYSHGMLDPWFKYEYPFKHLKKTVYWHFLQHRVLRGAAGVLFTCEEERQLARTSFSPYQVTEEVVSYGTTLPTQLHPNNRETFLDAYPNLRGRRVLLFLGRIHEKKGCDLLIEAFADTAAHVPTLHLVMAGPDQAGWHGQLQMLAEEHGIADRVTWTGLLQGDLKWGALLAAEAFVLPSHQENFGIAVAEALAVGTPVLISNKVNIWREIEADQAGFVAPDTLDGTVNLLQRWLALTADERAKMGRRSADCFAKRFEMRRATENLLHVIRKKLNHN
jgi:glycosyltransferase involved in cell wall biosynthesis